MREHCLGGSGVEWAAGPEEQASGGSMQPLEAQLRQVLLYCGTCRLADVWKICEEKEDGEAEHLQDGQEQSPHSEYGRRLHFG